MYSECNNNKWFGFNIMTLGLVALLLISAKPFSIDNTSKKKKCLKELSWKEWNKEVNRYDSLSISSDRFHQSTMSFSEFLAERRIEIVTKDSGLFEFNIDSVDAFRFCFSLKEEKKCELCFYSSRDLSSLMNSIENKSQVNVYEDTQKGRKYFYFHIYTVLDNIVEDDRFLSDYQYNFKLEIKG